MAYDPKKKYDPDLNYNDLANQAARSGDYGLAEHYLTARGNKIQDQGGDDRGVSNDSIRQGWSQYPGYTDYYQTPPVQTPPVQATAQQAASGAQPAQQNGDPFRHISAPDTSALRSTLNQWLENTRKASETQIDDNVRQGVNELARTLEDSDERYQNLRDQAAVEEARALDKQGLDRAVRGDRGGIGAAQADSIRVAAAQNRLAISKEQTRVRTDILRQIEDLRASGRSDKEKAAVEAANQYLLALMDLERLDLTNTLTVAQINSAIDQARAEYGLRLKELDISSQQFNRQMEYQERRDQIADRRYDQEYQDSRADVAWARQYQKEQDQKADRRYENETAYQRQQDALNREAQQDATAYAREQDRLNREERADATAYERQQAAKQEAYNNAIAQLNVGLLPSDADLAAAGIDKNYALAYQSMVLANKELEKEDRARQAEAAAAELENKRADTLKKASEAGKAAQEAGKAEKPPLTLDETKTALSKGNITSTTLDAYEYYYGESWYKTHEDKLSPAAQSYIKSIQTYQARTGDKNLSEMHKDLLTRGTQKGNITDAELGYILDKFHWR